MLKTDYEIFFIFWNKDQTMPHEMDHMCTTILIATVVIVLYIGFVEMNKIKTRYANSTSTTCGMKSKNNIDMTSAKKSMLENKTGKKDTSFMTITEEWPVEDTGCKHKEMEQNNEELSKAFGKWEADSESTQKYIDASVDQTKAKNSANTRAIDINTSGRVPLSAKNLGTPGFMTAVRESAGKGVENVKFADSCVEFLQSDAYVQARQDMNLSCGR